MTTHHCEGLERGLFHTGMPTTTITDGQCLTNAVNTLVKKIGIEKQSSGFTCNGSGNLAKYHNLLENTGKIQEYL